MFDKLIDVALQFVGLFKFWHIVTPCQDALVCTWGKETRRLHSNDGWFGTGLHLKAPLDIEEVYALSNSTRVDEFAAKSLTTADGRVVSLGVVATYRVHDVSKAIFSVFEPFQAICDAVQGEVATLVSKTNYADLWQMNLTEVCRKRGFKYGMEIDEVRISTLAPTKAITLIQNSSD
jgi:regulator of protease activity HflC (stomatin/prohibitin superfamily)